MLRDQLSAFHDAVRFGPQYCPAALFDGDAAGVLRGLKVYANNIACARQVALEETYPRLLQEIGAGAFHAAVERFLDNEMVLDRSLDGLGDGFDAVLGSAADRDLARLEWAWLQSFHAAEAEALTMPAVAEMTAELLVEVPVVRHPAARLVPLEDPLCCSWDEPLAGDGAAVLITRPDAEVRLRQIAAGEAAMFDVLEQGPRCGELLGDDPSGLVTLIEAGAIMIGDPW